MWLQAPIGRSIRIGSNVVQKCEGTGDEFGCQDTYECRAAFEETGASIRAFGFGVTARAITGLAGHPHLGAVGHIHARHVYRTRIAATGHRVVMQTCNRCTKLRGTIGGRVHARYCRCHRSNSQRQREEHRKQDSNKGQVSLQIVKSYHIQARKYHINFAAKH